MTRLPLQLRLFWGVFFVLAAALLAVPIGPFMENWLAPVREPGARIESVGRGPAYLWFDWVGTKNRTPLSPGADVSMHAAGDDFDLGLFNDLSLPGEPRCTRVAPWSRLLLVDTGFHRQPFCIEIPRSVTPTDAIRVDVVLRYRGLFGLWDTWTRFPAILAR